MIRHNLVSVMMPAFNAEAYIQTAIDSLIHQSYEAWELIVIDDGSTDSTPKIVRGYADPRIRMYHQPNGGEASARNAALHHLRGEYIAFLDTDDIFLPHHLQVMVDLLASNDDLGGVYTDGNYIDERGRELEKLSTRRRGPFEGFIFEQVVRSSDVFGPPVCMLLRRKSITDHDLYYDETIGLGMDWDFITRFSEHSKFGYIKDVTCEYRIHQSNLTLVTSTSERMMGRLKCRQKAMKLLGFSRCALEIRIYSFYDILVNILSGDPDRQLKTTQEPEFQALPAIERARLFRLMARSALLIGVES